MMSPYLLGPLHGMFMLLTLLGVILLMYWLIKHCKKETQMKVATWFLIIGFVGCAATLVGAQMLGRDQDGNAMFLRGGHMMNQGGLMQGAPMMPYAGEKSVRLAPANTNASLAPLNSNMNLVPVNMNQNG